VTASSPLSRRMRTSRRPWSRSMPMPVGMAKTSAPPLRPELSRKRRLARSKASVCGGPSEVKSAYSPSFINKEGEWLLLIYEKE